MTNYKVRFADINDLFGIKKLWLEIFEDSIQFINEFLNYFPNNIDIIICEENNVVYSMACFIDIASNSFKGKYLYALATSRRNRKQHMATNIINFAKDYYANNHYDFILTIPAKQKLVPFYDNLGFINKTFKRTYTEEGTSFKIFPKQLNSKELYQMRQNNIKITKFNEQFTNFLFDDLVNDGWMILGFKKSYCVCRISEDEFFVRESYGNFPPLSFANALGYNKTIVNCYDTGEVFSQYMSFKNDVAISNVGLLIEK